jgi:hypothetical protein
MPKQLAAKSTVILLVIASAYGTVHLGGDYLRALFGRPEAQWQFAFLWVPLPILFGLVAVAITKFARPPLHKAFALSAWVGTLLPVALSALVGLHAY